MTPTVAYFDLADDERAQTDDLLRTLAGRYDSAEDHEFVASAGRLAAQLPDRLLDAVGAFRREETSASLVVRGLGVDDTELGPTPLNWRHRANPAATRRYELYLLLVSAALGEVFGWSTLQDGRLVHDVLPMPAEKDEQSGHGTVRLEWHTEDGFHPFRCDYLLLLGLRNPDEVGTTVAGVDAVSVTPERRAVLRQSRFLIRPDNEHLNRAADLVAGTGRTHSMQVMQDAPEPCAVLFGDDQQPYLRVDPAFMEPLPGDTEAKDALADLVNQLEDQLREVTVGPGDLFIVDNYKAVHGRSAFQARYDGTDRWLKKAVCSRDLRKSRSLRPAAGARVVC
ncbi:guanitoxin biosynthesis L-enduracididine beta-hydroxylase GntD [Actinocrispum wychmicini]|uniref:Fe(II)/alpha-ketoglutarate-dependent arginine beta-hydroxylase n=1 Tax=Actinocrispum wychmicini TaxID=1213861 RepID=A0A4V2S6L3_9PSEU|nr:guanitoxin biosynthesis L-enduracididine beta-hydroxylase GntD [Actinocrispum wychmicini]TCO56100.1 Fe(II)/alpha-ketoglutarate-dependent arginine beta-hydroxylase [Actinocrispum wychmicini]